MATKSTPVTMDVCVLMAGSRVVGNRTCIMPALVCARRFVMGALLSQVIPLALGAAISPVLFLLTLTTLTGERRLVRGLALTAGAAVPLVLLAVVAFAIAGKLPLSGTTKAVVDPAVRVLLPPV